MGGHSAWRKRVAEGRLAKEGTGGAIARHRPRWGRKGKDLKLNRKGNRAGGNPKRTKKGKQRSAVDAKTNTRISTRREEVPVQEKVRTILIKWGFVIVSGFIYLYLRKNWSHKESEFPGL
jgi:hypothetical protein